VFIETSFKRAVARMEFPSQRQWRICALLSVASLFIMIFIRERSRIVNQFLRKFEPKTPYTGLNLTHYLENSRMETEMNRAR